MTTHVTASPSSVAIIETSKVEVPTERRWLPIHVWAVLGILFVAFQLYLYIRGIAAGNAKENDFGRSTAPGWMVDAMWVHVALGFATLAGMLYWFLVRPWRAGRVITSDGLLMLACLTCFWQDLAANYFRYQVVYPTIWPNLGSWYNFIPGWSAPNGQIQAEATIFFLPMYAVCMFGFTSIAMGVMHRVQRRVPSVSKVTLFLIAWLTLGLTDLILEVFWVRLGLFTYPGAIHGWTLFYGHYYQFPIYESLLWGLGWATLTSFRYFRNSRGETAPERGLSHIAAAPYRRVLLRLLAMVAAANIGLLGYNVAMGAVGAASPHWPTDFTSRPYLTDGLCGPRAPYACAPGTLGRSAAR